MTYSTATLNGYPTLNLGAGQTVTASALTPRSRARYDLELVLSWDERRVWSSTLAISGPCPTAAGTTNTNADCCMVHWLAGERIILVSDDCATFLEISTGIVVFQCILTHTYKDSLDGLYFLDHKGNNPVMVVATARTIAACSPDGIIWHRADFALIQGLALAGPSTLSVATIDASGDLGTLELDSESGLTQARRSCE